MSGGSDWRPGASFATLRTRAALIGQIRAYFRDRGVLEVETPSLASGAATEPHLASLTCRVSGSPREYYLQTSPEFAMKRLLASGSGPIFQIAKAFRDGEFGRLHNPEFTILEWYRPGLAYEALMDEVDEMVQGLLGIGAARRVSYVRAFEELALLDPLRAPISLLRSRVESLGITPGAKQLERDDCLELIQGALVQPRLGPGPVLVHDFPASQSSLARLRTNDHRLAERFELFVNGVELANGAGELDDADEQRRRFEVDLKERRRRGLPSVALDEHLLAAMSAGLPRCAGVALGIDRLVMLATGTQTLGEVMSFTTASA